MTELRRKITEELLKAYEREASTSKAWNNEKQILETSVLKEMKKLSSDEILKGVQVYVEPDAIFLNIRMENVDGYIFHSRYNHPDEVMDDAVALKNYFKQSGYIPEDTEYGFSVILKP